MPIKSTDISHILGLLRNGYSISKEQRDILKDNGYDTTGVRLDKVDQTSSIFSAPALERREDYMKEWLRNLAEDPYGLQR
jgi:hypothetical protein